MSTTVPPRLPEHVKEVVRRQIAKQAASAPVQLSRMLRDVRSTVDASHVPDEELVRQIVMDATNRGLSVHFDQGNRLDAENLPGSQPFRGASPR